MLVNSTKNVNDDVTMEFCLETYVIFQRGKLVRTTDIKMTNKLWIRKTNLKEIYTYLRINEWQRIHYVKIKEELENSIFDELNELKKSIWSN